MTQHTTMTQHTSPHDHDRAFAAHLRRGAPEEFAKFVDFDQTVFGREDSVIPRRAKELMALAVALTTQCPMCIQGHSEDAKRHGATAEEIAETVFIATAMRAGAAYTHGMAAMRYYRAFEVDED